MLINLRSIVSILSVINCLFISSHCLSSSSSNSSSWGGLYPRESPTREVKSLDGLWHFRLAPKNDPEMGFREEWFKKPLSQTGKVVNMPVPSSYNDVTEDKAFRDHVGWAWYDRHFFVPSRWQKDKLRIIIRVGSAHYNSLMYLNGELISSHDGGHLPFMADVTNSLHFDCANLLTITINNTLTPTTIPQGKIVYKHDPTKYPEGYFVQTYNFDFFNYAGIHRPVYIYTTPQLYIDDISVSTDVNGTTGSISYNVTYKDNVSSKVREGSCSLKVYNKIGQHVTSAIGCIGQITIENAQLWWPHLMHENPGHLYTLMITVSNEFGMLDTYPQRVGIRKLGWNATTLTINGEKLYLRGCGKHEDSDIRGKGVDFPLITKDFSLLKWLGANSFRTSHYPYAEEIMDVADEEGIMVIDESPAVGLSGFGETLLTNHKNVMLELLRRDKNRPSVIMWSVGNEPRSMEEAAKKYFQEVVSWTKSLDNSRPVTCVLSTDIMTDLAAPSLDVILVNRYFGWYGDTGHSELIQRQTISEFTAWHLVYQKPVMISEYGAGTIAGIHIQPSFVWSEEYQVTLMMENFKAFDILRKEGFFFGEHIWNFADFATEQETFRPPGCMKGVFTRNRQPKMAAHFMRWRYWDLAKHLDNATFHQDTPLLSPQLMAFDIKN